MTNEEKKRLGLVLSSLNEFNEFVSREVDLSRVELEDNLRNYIMSDNYLVQLEMLNNRKFEISNMYSYASNLVCSKYPDMVFSDECKYGKDYGNFYFIEFNGDIVVNFIFDNNGKLIFMEEGKNAIEVVDTNNIFINRKNNDGVFSFNHYQFCNGEFRLLNTFCDVDENVFSLSNYLIELVDYSSGDIKRILYNYKSGDVVLDDYDYVSFNIGNFEFFDNLAFDKLRVVKKIKNGNKSKKLEFLIDKKGRVSNLGVYDFANSVIYPISGDCNEQVNELFRIYKKSEVDVKKRNKLRIKK